MSILLRSYGYNSVLVFIFFEKWLDLRSHEFSFIVSGVSVLYPCTLILTIPSWIMFRGIDQRVHIFKLYANWIYPNSVEPLKQCASVGSLFLNECYVSLWRSMYSKNCNMQNSSWHLIMCPVNVSIVHITFQNNYMINLQFQAFDFRTTMRNEPFLQLFHCLYVYPLTVSLSRKRNLFIRVELREDDADIRRQPLEVNLSIVIYLQQYAYSPFVW